MVMPSSPPHNGFGRAAHEPPSAEVGFDQKAPDFFDRRIKQTLETQALGCDLVRTRHVSSPFSAASNASRREFQKRSHCPSQSLASFSRSSRSEEHQSAIQPLMRISYSVL